MRKLVLLFFLVLVAGCTTNSVNLSAARELEGTWETSSPVKFYIKTDFIGFELEDVGSEDRMMTWDVTSWGENEVYVDVYFTSSNMDLISGSGYTPDVSPMSLYGTISGTRLILADSRGRMIGNFSFTNDIIQGTWDDSWELAYAQEVYTEADKLILRRQ